MSENFKTYKDALLFCAKYRIAYPANTSAYVLAEALLLAYNAGAKERLCICAGWPREKKYCTYCGGCIEVI